MADAAELPKWWTNLDAEKQEYYLRLHPRSKMHKVASAQLKERLAKRPKERTKLRSILKTIAKDPKRLLKGDFNKIKEAAANLKDEDREKIDTQVKDALKKKSPKRMLKAIVTTLAVAGALTIGGAAMAAGGLPYAIIGARLFGDGKQAIQEVYNRVKEGQSTAKAIFGTIATTMSRAANDPKMLAAALLLQNKRDNEDGKPKQSDSKKPEKTEPKRQSVPKSAKKPSKGNS